MKHAYGKKGFAAIIVMSLLVVCAACGGAPQQAQSNQTTAPTTAPTESATTAPETTAPQTDAPETTAPQTDAPEDTGAKNANEGAGAGEAGSGYDLSGIKSKLTEAYMGITEANEGAYFASNDDGSFVIVAFYDPETNESVSFVGPGTTTEDGLAQVTDVENGLTLSFSVEAQEDGTLIIDMGDIGKAHIEACTIDDIIDALQKISDGSNPLL